MSDESKGTSKMPMVIGLVGALVALFVVVYFLLPAEMVPWLYTQ